jgi:hypothetical protein
MNKKPVYQFSREDIDREGVSYQRQLLGAITVANVTLDDTSKLSSRVPDCV